ncbi:hypothetical protein Tco_0722179 [Tanacetum coccineum]
MLLEQEKRAASRALRLASAVFAWLVRLTGGLNCVGFAMGLGERGAGCFCRHLCQYHVPSAATAAIVSAVCQANDHGFGGLGGFSALDLYEYFEQLDLFLMGKPLTKIDSLGDHDSDDQIASVDNDMTNFLVSKMVVYGTNSLLEQWKESYANGDYDFDPYDDDMYKGQDIPDKIQDICDNLDIKVRGRTIPVTSESISQIFVLLLSRLELEGLKWNLAAYIRKVLPLGFITSITIPLCLSDS